MNYIPELVPTPTSAALVDFTNQVTGALAKLKCRLEAHYQHALPNKTELVRAAIAEAEACAWRLSFFPHLLLPDLVEARIAEMAMPPAESYPHAA